MCNLDASKCHNHLHLTYVHIMYISMKYYLMIILHNLIVGELTSKRYLASRVHYEQGRLEQGI